MRGVFWVTRTKECCISYGQQAFPTPAGVILSTPKVMGQHRRSKLKKAPKRKYVRKKLRVISDEKIRLTGSRLMYYPRNCD